MKKIQLKNYEKKFIQKYLKKNHHIIFSKSLRTDNKISNRETFKTHQKRTRLLIDTHSLREKRKNNLMEINNKACIFCFFHDFERSRGTY